MKKFKRILSAALVLTLCLTMVSCGKKNPPAQSSTPDASSSQGDGDWTKPSSYPVVVRFATGPLNAYQNILYNAVANLVNESFPNMYSIAIDESTGSTENARLLTAGEIDFGTMGADITLKAFNATDEFSDYQAGAINYVATHSGTGATVQVIAAPNSGIETIYDLKDKKVGVTAGIMAGYFNDVLWAHDMTADDLKSLTNLSLADLCNNLKDGTIDAFLYATPAPSTNFTDLATSSGIKLIDIGEEIVNKLIEAKPQYHRVDIPAGTYAGVDHDVVTFAQWTMLCCRADLDDETVYNIVKTFLENGETLEAIHKNAKGTSAESGSRGSLIPIHPGALKYFQDAGVLTEDPNAGMKPSK